MENRGVMTYCLTKDNYIGGVWSDHIELGINKKVLFPICQKQGHTTSGRVKKVPYEDIILESSNFKDIRKKLKELSRESLLKFLNFKNIVLNISSITYYGLQFNFDYKIEKRLSRVLKVYNLKLVHLKQHDAYVLLDTKDISKNKNIEIQSLCIHTGEVIGRQGRNINQIKEELGIRNISVKSLSFDEFEPIKKEFQELLEKLETYLKD